jgi:hypothetical protein
VIAFASFPVPVMSFSVVIILCSDGKLVDDWYILKIKIQPQVWVTVLSTLSNMMLIFAFAEGLTIRFWRQAGQGAAVRRFFYLAMLQDISLHRPAANPWPAANPSRH